MQRQIHGVERFLGRRSDRKTGRPLWETELIDYPLSYSGTLAPLAVKDMVMVGAAGGEYGGIRGFIDAFDLEPGERRWRFYTIPGPGSLRGAAPPRPRQPWIRSRTSSLSAGGWEEMRKASSTSCLASSRLASLL